jgi:hypothetical protein
MCNDITSFLINFIIWYDYLVSIQIICQWSQIQRCTTQQQKCTTNCYTKSICRTKATSSEKCYHGQHRQKIKPQSLTAKSLNWFYTKQNACILDDACWRHQKVSYHLNRLYEDVERIKGAYQSRITIQTQIDLKLRDIADKISAVDNEVGSKD